MPSRVADHRAKVRRRAEQTYTLAPETVVRLEMLAEEAELPPSRYLDQVVRDRARSAGLDTAEVDSRCRRLKRAKRLL